MIGKPQRLVDRDGTPIVPNGWQEQVVGCEDADETALNETCFRLSQLAGRGVIRHVEVRHASPDYFECIAVGLPRPVTLDQLIELRYDPDTGLPRGSVLDVYVCPVMSVGDLRGWVALHDKEPQFRPALVVQVPTKRFLFERDTTRLDRDAAPVAPATGSSVSPQVWVELLPTTTRAEGSILPRVSLPLLGPSDTRVLGDNWSVPVPDVTAEFTPATREQLTKVFRYMSAIHVGRSPATRDLPTGLQLLSKPTAPVTYYCTATGFRDPIRIQDMLRLQLCAPSQIQCVYYDFSALTRCPDRPGALTLELTAATTSTGPLLQSDVWNAQNMANMGLVRLLAPVPASHDKGKRKKTGDDMAIAAKKARTL